MSVDDPRTAWEREQWDRCDTEALCRLADATQAVDVTTYVAEMRTPTLVLAPTVSPLTPLEDQLYLRTAIPDAELELFEGVGHTVYQDEPERCIARFLQFVEHRHAH
jgi:pimeloyl-ACP methyl ester carboxylesterase